MLHISPEKPAGLRLKINPALGFVMWHQTKLLSPDVDHLHQIPLNLQAQGIPVRDSFEDWMHLQQMHMEWSAMVDKVMNLKNKSRLQIAW